MCKCILIGDQNAMWKNLQNFQESLKNLAKFSRKYVNMGIMDTVKTLEVRAVF